MIGEYQIEYVTSYWDGPSGGLCSKDGVKYFFRCDDIAVNPRSYSIYALSPEQLQVVNERITDFEKCVGTHNTYVDGKRNPGAIVHPKSEWGKFYSKWGGRGYEHGEMVDSWIEIEMRAT